MRGYSPYPFNFFLPECSCILSRLCILLSKHGCLFSRPFFISQWSINGPDTTQIRVRKPLSMLNNIQIFPESCHQDGSCKSIEKNTTYPCNCSHEFSTSAFRARWVVPYCCNGNQCPPEGFCHVGANLRNTGLHLKLLSDVCIHMLRNSYDHDDHTQLLLDNVFLISFINVLDLLCARDDRRCI